jgi:hypothetical protein
MNVLTLNIQRNLDYYIVQILENDQWAIGDSIREAIGNLVLDNPETFCVVFSEKDYTPPYTKGHLNGVPQFDCPIESGYSHT